MMVYVFIISNDINSITQHFKTYILFNCFSLIETLSFKTIIIINEFLDVQVE